MRNAKELTERALNLMDQAREDPDRIVSLTQEALIVAILALAVALQERK